MNKIDVKVLQHAREITAGFFADRRKEKKITQEQLAAMMEVNTSTIGRIEAGKFYMRQDILFKLCHYLDLAPFFIPKESEQFKEFQKQMQYKVFDEE